MATRPTSPGIKLMLDGQEYSLRLDFTAMADFESATGDNVLALLGKVVTQLQALPQGEVADIGNLLGNIALSAKDLQALVWACLGGEDSPVDLRAAGRLIHVGNLAEVIPALVQAITSAFPAAKEGEQSGPPALQVAGEESGPDG